DVEMDAWTSPRLVDLFLDHRGLAALVAVHAVATFVVGYHFGIEYDTAFHAHLRFFKVLVPFILIAILVFRLGVMITIHRPRRPLAWLGNDLAYSGLNGICGTALMILFIKDFSDLKSAIPTINPFSWDQDFASLDLNLGRHLPRWFHAS